MSIFSIRTAGEGLKFIGEVAVPNEGEPLDIENLVRFDRDSQFKKWFYPNEVKLEPNESKQTLLCCSELSVRLLDRQVISEIGGENRAKTTLFDVLSLVKKQREGKIKALLKKSGHWNIFYIPDLQEVVRSVYVGFPNEPFNDLDDWHIGANYIDDPGGWGAGQRVFYPKPVRIAETLVGAGA